MADTAVAADAGAKIIDWMKNPEEMDSALEGLEASPWDNLITVSMAPLQKYCKTALRGLKVQHKKILSVDQELHEFKDRTEKSFAREDEMEQQIASMRETIEDLMAWKRSMAAGAAPSALEAKVAELEAREQEQMDTIQALQRRVDDLTGRQENDESLFSLLKLQSSKTEEQMSVIERALARNSGLDGLNAVVDGLKSQIRKVEAAKVDRPAVEKMLAEMRESIVPAPPPEVSFEGMSPEEMQKVFAQLHDGLVQSHAEVARLHGEVGKLTVSESRVRELERRMEEEFGHISHLPTAAAIADLQHLVKGDVNGLPRAASNAGLAGEAPAPAAQSPGGSLPAAEVEKSISLGRDGGPEEDREGSVTWSIKKLFEMVAKTSEGVEQALRTRDDVAELRALAAKIDRKVDEKVEPLEHAIGRAGEAASAAGQRVAEVEGRLREEASDLRGTKADRAELMSLLDTITAGGGATDRSVGRVGGGSETREVSVSLGEGNEELEAILNENLTKLKAVQQQAAGLGSTLMRKADTEHLLRELTDVRKEIRDLSSELRDLSSSSAGAGVAAASDGGSAPLRVDIINPVELKGFARQEDLSGLLSTIKDMLGRTNGEVERTIESLSRQVRELGESRASSASVDGVRSLLDTSMGEMRKSLRAKSEAEDVAQMRREVLAEIEAVRAGGGGGGGAHAAVAAMAMSNAGGAGDPEALEKIMQGVLATSAAVAKVQADVARCASTEELRGLRAEVGAKMDSEASKQAQSEVMAQLAHLDAKASSALAEYAETINLTPQTRSPEPLALEANATSARGEQAAPRGASLGALRPPPLTAVARTRRAQGRLTKSEMRGWVDERLRDLEALGGARPAAAAEPAAELRGVPEALAKALEELETKMEQLDRMMTGTLEMERRRTGVLEAQLDTVKDTLARKAGRSQMLEEFEKLQAQLKKIAEASSRLRAQKADKKQLDDLAALLKGLKLSGGSDHVLMAGRPVEAWRCLSCDRGPIALSPEALGADDTPLSGQGVRGPPSPEPRRQRSMHERSMETRQSLDDNLQLRSMDMMSSSSGSPSPGPRTEGGWEARHSSGSTRGAATPPPNFMTGKRDLMAEASGERMGMGRSPSSSSVSALPPVRFPSEGMFDDTAGGIPSMGSLPHI